MDPKRNELISKIRDKYRRKYNSDIESLMILEHELNRLSSKPKLTIYDLNDIESKISATSRFSGSVSPVRKIDPDVSASTSLKPDLALYRRANSSIKKAGVDLNNNLALRSSLDISEALAPNHPVTMFHPYSYTRQNTLARGNLSLVEPKMNQSGMSEFSPMSALTPGARTNSSYIGSSPISRKLTDRENAKKHNLWTKLQEYNQMEHEKNEYDQKEKKKLQNQMISNELAKQVEFKKRQEEQRKEQEMEENKRMIEASLKEFKDRVQREQGHRKQVKDKELQFIAEASQVINDKFMRKMESQRSQLDQRLIDEDNYKKDLTEVEKIKKIEKTKILDGHQKTISAKHALARELEEQQKQKDQQYVKGLIESQKKMEFDSYLFQEGIKSKFNDKTDRIYLHFKDKIAKKEPIDHDKIVHKGLLNKEVPDPKQYAAEKIRRKQQLDEILQKQIHQRNELSKNYDEYINEQKTLWTKESEKVEDRENHLREQEMAKKKLTKAALEIQRERDRLAKKNPEATPHEIWLNRKTLKKMGIQPEDIISQ